MKLEKVYEKLINTLSPTINSNKKYWVIAASLDHHNNIISIGENSYQKTHPMQSRFSRQAGNRDREYLHAEIASLVKNRSIVESIMVVRMTCGGLVRMARPCNICNLALREAGIKYIYFSGDDEILHKEEICY
jgi:deoxycytidylate deaminase